MLNRKFINEKVSETTVFDLFNGDVSETIAKIKQIQFKFGNVQMIVSENNPMQIDILKGRYETNEEYNQRILDEKSQNAKNIEHKKKKLFEHLKSEYILNN